MFFVDPEAGGGGHCRRDGHAALHWCFVAVDAVDCVRDDGLIGQGAGDAHDELDGSGGAGGEIADGPGDGAAGRGAARGGRDERGGARLNVGEGTAAGVGIAGVGVRERVGQIGAGADRVGRVGGRQRQDRGGGDGGGDGGAAHGDRLVAVDTGRRVGKRGALRQAAGPYTTLFRSSGGAGGEIADGPGDGAAGRGAARGGR